MKLGMVKTWIFLGEDFCMMVRKFLSNIGTFNSTNRISHLSEVLASDKFFDSFTKIVLLSLLL